jgi:hypothetical protein
MSSTLRATAVAGCTALLLAGTSLSTAAQVSASSNALFTVSPSFGAANQTITLTAAGTTDFTGATGVTINNVAATDVQSISAQQITAVVPNGATSGPVAVLFSSTPTVVGPTFILQQPTTATSTFTPSVLTFGQKATVTGRLTALSGLTTGAVAGAKAELQHEAVGSTVWRHAAGTAVKRTGRGGGVRWSLKPANNGRFRVVFASSENYTSATSTPLSVAVRPNIKLQKLTTAPALSTSHIIGQVLPRLSGQVYLQKHTSAGWHRVAHKFAHHGKFSFPISPAALGKLHYRIVRHQDSSHLEVVTHPLNITVVHRQLEYGNVGADVLALWKRLHALHYDVGARTRSYGWDLVHAVTAFEKVQGISRDGKADTAVWNRLAHPKRPHLRYPIANGYAVEVNLTKEILLISKNGKLWRILDTSTGGGYTFTDSAGQPAVAITPSGHFSFLYKQTGWQHSKLGYLYYPSYFTSTGIAIHGEDNGNDGSEVPSYPASHGCVRISNNAVLRYYYKVFTVGTSVWVYH